MAPVDRARGVLEAQRAGGLPLRDLRGRRRAPHPAVPGARPPRAGRARGRRGPLRIAHPRAVRRAGRGAGLPQGDAARDPLRRAGPLLEEPGYCSGDMSQTIELPRTEGPDSALGGAWRVIVRNDDHNTFDGVAHTLAPLTPGITRDPR